jgi:hypothetical protein
MLEIRRALREFDNLLDTNGADVLYEVVLDGVPLDIPYYFEESENEYRSECCHFHTEVPTLFTMKCSDFPERLSVQVAYRANELRAAVSDIIFKRKDNTMILHFGLSLDPDSNADFLWNHSIYMKAMRYAAAKAGYEVSLFKMWEDSYACTFIITFELPVSGTINDILHKALVAYDDCDRLSRQMLVKRAGV